MADVQAIKILTKRKKVHEKFWDLLKSKQKSKLLNSDQEILKEVEETSRKVDEIKEYIFNIQAEMEALIASQKSFIIQLYEEMERMTEEGLLKDNSKSVERNEGGVEPTKKEGVLGFVNAVLSKLEVFKNRDGSGDSDASSGLRRKRELERLTLLKKTANLQQAHQELIDKISEAIYDIETKQIDLDTGDMQEISKALKKWSNCVKELNEKQELKSREQEEEKRPEEEKGLKIEDERKHKEGEGQNDKEKAKTISKEDEGKQSKINEKRNHKEEEQREITEEKRKKEEEEKRRRWMEEENQHKAEEMNRTREGNKKEEEVIKIKEQKKEEILLQEEERKIKEEARRKEEIQGGEKIPKKEIITRRDHNNWPFFIYHREEEKSSFHCGICCAVSAIENNPPLLKDDLICSFSNKLEDLNKCMENKDEALMSSLIQIQYKNDIEMSFEIPLRIFIPHANLPANREIVLKTSINGGKWVSEHNVLELTTTVSMVSKNLVGGSFQSFKKIKLIAVSRSRREHIVMDGTRSCFTSQVNSDISIRIPSDSLKKDTSFHLKVDDGPLLKGEIQNDDKKIKVVTPLVGVEFDDGIKDDYCIQMQPNYVDKTEFKTTYAKVLHECSQEFSTNSHEILQILEEKNILSDETINHIRSKHTNEMMVRALLDEFKDCNAETFENLQDILKGSSQAHLATSLRNSLVEIQNEEAKVGSDFIDFIKPMLHVALSIDNGKWIVIDPKSTTKLPNVVFVQLPSRGQRFDILGLVVPKEMTQDGICSMAEEIYRRTYQTVVRLIVRQHVDDPTDVNIRCVEASKSHVAELEMEGYGFKSGPTEMAEFGLYDNEEVFFKATGNISFISNPSSLIFFLNFDMARLHVKVTIKNKYAHPNGKVEYYVGEHDQNPPISGSFDVSLPKDEEFETHDRSALDISVRIMAKFIARHMTDGNCDIQEFYSRLAVNPRQLMNYQTRKLQKEADNGTERKICETCITNWVKGRFKWENKVRILLEIVRGLSPKLVLRAEKFIEAYSGEGAPLADKGIEKMSNFLQDKWKELAFKLDFEEDVIEAIEMDIPDDKERALGVLQKWRLSDFAIEKDTNIVRYLHEVMLGIGCSEELLLLLKQRI